MQMIVSVAEALGTVSRGKFLHVILLISFNVLNFQNDDYFSNMIILHKNFKQNSLVYQLSGCHLYMTVAVSCNLV